VGQLQIRALSPLKKFKNQHFAHLAFQIKGWDTQSVT
jgi:hypothetical protein